MPALGSLQRLRLVVHALLADGAQQRLRRPVRVARWLPRINNGVGRQRLGLGALISGTRNVNVFLVRVGVMVMAIRGRNLALLTGANT